MINRDFLKNKTIFINILGNFLLFMPLGYILVKITKMRILLNILLGIGIIIILEIIQFITKRGVLDIADILLNSLGLFISIIPKLLNESCVLGFNGKTAISLLLMVIGFCFSFFLSDLENNLKKLKKKN